MRQKPRDRRVLLPPDNPNNWLYSVALTLRERRWENPRSASRTGSGGTLAAPFDAHGKRALEEVGAGSRAGKAGGRDE